MNDFNNAVDKWLAGKFGAEEYTAENKVAIEKAANGEIKGFAQLRENFIGDGRFEQFCEIPNGVWPLQPPFRVRKLWQAMREIYGEASTPLQHDYISKRGAGQNRTPEQQYAHESALLVEANKCHKALKGSKFEQGRKPNTGSVIRKCIAKILEKKPAMKNPELWKAVADKPPRGWTAYDNRVGKYLEGKENKNMSYERFCNVCGEERKKIIR